MSELSVIMGREWWNRSDEGGQLCQVPWHFENNVRRNSSWQEFEE